MSEPAEWTVVVNDEEQYSIWPAGRELPSGWRTVSGAQPKDGCLKEIERLWVDMRPKSVR